MHEHRTKMNENGRIVIPSAFRQQLQLEAGDELILILENKELRIISAKQLLKKAQALVKSHTKGKSLVKELFEMRKEDKKT